MFYLNVFFIAIICVIVTDLTDFFGNVKEWISLLLTKGRIRTNNYRLHWLDCPLCQTNIIGIITMCIMGCISIPNYLYILAIAYATPIIKDVIILAETAINTAIQAIMRKLN